MSTKVSKTAIGAFVIGAIVLFVAAVLVFGAGKIFTTEHTYVTYFDGSVKGLNVGSPVTFHGVKVGEVTDISIIYDAKSRSLKIPVIFNLEPGKFKGVSADFQKYAGTIEKAVKELGLRSQLQTMSFVTGQLMVALEFMPDTSAVFIGLITEYPEIPSVPTPLEQLQKTFENLPFKEIVTNLNDTLKEVEHLVKSIDAKKTLQAVEYALADVRILVRNVNAKVDPLAEDVGTLVRNVNAKVDPLAESVTKTTGAAQEALNETRDTMATVRSELPEIVAAAKSTLGAAQAALKQSEQTLQAFSDESRTVTELNKTLRELSGAARALRNLSDYLERHPESLIRGKAEAKGD